MPGASHAADKILSILAPQTRLYQSVEKHAGCFGKSHTGEPHHRRQSDSFFRLLGALPCSFTLQLKNAIVVVRNRIPTAWPSPMDRLPAKRNVARDCGSATPPEYQSPPKHGELFLHG